MKSATLDPTEQAPADTVLDTSGTSPAAQPTNRFFGMTPKALGEFDLASASHDDIHAFAEAASKVLARVTNGGVIVDPGNGIVYLGGSIVGNVNRPAKAPQVIPSAWNAKEEYIDTNGVVALPGDKVSKGGDMQKVYTVASIRIAMAGITGNGVNLVGQKAKSLVGAANAAGTQKGRLL